MGYYTKYKLTFDKRLTEEQENEIIKAFVGIEDTELTEQDAIELVKYSYYGKWYENERDMKAISKMFPNIEFTLNGHGEDAGDEWTNIYKNGELSEMIDSTTKGFRNFIENNDAFVIKSELEKSLLKRIEKKTNEKGGKVDFDVIDRLLPTTYNNGEKYFVIQVEVINGKVNFIGEKNGAWSDGETENFSIISIEEMIKTLGLI